MKLEITQIRKKMLSNSRVIKEDRIIEYVIAIVGKFYMVDNLYTSIKSRKREYVFARQVAMWLISKYSTATLEKIGSQFAGKDHATVLHAKKVINNLIDTDRKVKEQIKDLENIIKLNTKAIVGNLDLNDHFYYIDFNNYTSIKVSNEKGIMLTGFSDDEIDRLKQQLKGGFGLESKKHENTGLYILEEKQEKSEEHIESKDEHNT